MSARSLACCVCGGHAGRWQQHWNRDTGFGVCAKCVAWQRERGTPETEIEDLYGKEGFNWGAWPPVYETEEEANEAADIAGTGGRSYL